MRAATLALIVIVGAAGLALPALPVSAQGFGCQFERVEYVNDGLTIRGGVFYNGDGIKRPILVHIRGASANREAERRPSSEAVMPQAVACQFVMTYNWTVFAADRRGFGGSDGEGWSELAARTTGLSRSAQGLLFVRRSYEEAGDVRAGIRVVQGRPYAQREYVVWGVSAGGIIAMLIGADPLPGLMAVVSTVGGLGWNLASGCTTCYFEEVFAAATEAGRKIDTPILLQAGSLDPFLIPNRRLYQDLTVAGKNVAFVEYEGFRHADFLVSSWRSNVQDLARFLLTLQPPVTSGGN